VARVARTFWRHWIVVVRPSLLLALRRALHCAAIGLAIGAILGMYARGLFFEYNVVWRSTVKRSGSPPAASDMTTAGRALRRHG
jgi:hypothetical protein